MAPGELSQKKFQKLAQLDKNVFESEWIRGCYQLIGAELPAQESVKTQHDHYHMELDSWMC